MPNSPIPSPPPIDAAANVPSLRTLGTGAQQAVAGNDNRLLTTVAQTITGLKTFTNGLTVGDLLRLAKINTVSLPSPISSTKGAVVYDNTTNTLKFSDGTAWVELVASTGAGYVSKAGDTMTGALSIGGAAVPLNLNSNDNGGSSASLIINNSGGGLGRPYAEFQLNGTMIGQVIAYNVLGNGLVDGLNLSAASGKSVGVRVGTSNIAAFSSTGLTMPGSIFATGQILTQSNLIVNSDTGIIEYLPASPTGQFDRVLAMYSSNTISTNHTLGLTIQTTAGLVSNAYGAGASLWSGTLNASGPASALNLYVGAHPHDGVTGVDPTKLMTFVGTAPYNVGIGTGSPSQRLHVVGTIYSSTGGFRFPDNTTQTTAAITTNAGGWMVVSNAVPNGAGTVSSKVFQDAGNTVLRSFVSSTATVTLTVKASYPLVVVNGVTATLTNAADGGHYSGNVNVTISGSAIPLSLTLPNGAPGAFSDSIAVTVNTPPVITSLSFTGSYPGAQTELKAGDTFQVSGTTDKPATSVQVSNFEAGISQTISFASTTSFSVTITIADRGTTAQAQHARMAAGDSTGAYGATSDTSNTVILNNLYPTLTFGTITYPASQGGLKNSETATVAVTTANLDSIIFDSPNGDLSVTAPTTIGSPKAVTRIAGSYNVSTNNFRGVATRNANAAVTTTQGVVNIANVAAVITVATPAARLRSGGNDGTTLQSHTITLTSDQQLFVAPTLNAGASGTFTGAWAGGPTVYTRTFQVHDNDVKGTYSWAGLSATNLAGIVTSSITTGASYVLGGFVARNLTFAAFSQTTSMGVAVTTYSKLTATIFTATNQPALLNATQGNHSSIANTYTVDSIGTNPTTVYWNDAAAASSNSSGTAQLQSLQETV